MSKSFFTAGIILKLNNRLLSSLLLFILPVIAVAQLTKQTSTRGVATRKSEINFIQFAEYERIHPRIVNPHAVHNEEEEESSENNFTPNDAPIINDNIPFLPASRAQGTIDSPPPVLNFLGIPDDGSIIPPDVHGAVGPNHIVETLNSLVRIFTRDGTVISTVSLDGFWSSLNNPSTFDPKIIYDPYSNRWIIVTVANAETADAAILVAVSVNDDPTGVWHLYSIDVDASGLRWFDYPSVGFNKNWIVVSGNMYNNTGGNSGSQVYAFSKSDLYAGGIGVHTLFSGSVFTAAPSITYSPTENNIYLVQSWSASNAQLRLYSISGFIGFETFTTVATINSVGSWDAGGGNFAQQYGSPETIDIGDHRMKDVIFRNGSLWATHTVFLPVGTPTHAVVQWWQLSTTGTVIQKGRIEDPAALEDYAYPSLAVNADDDVLLGYCRFSPSIYPAAAYALRKTTDPLNTLENGYTYKNGEAFYFKNFGGTRNRWGDYTAACVDPLNDTTLWTLGQYAKSPSSNWSTWWAEVNPNRLQWVDFTADSTTLCSGKSVQFSDRTNFPVTSWSWTFQGGTPATSTLPDPVVSFGLGSHTVTLVVNGTDSIVKPAYIVGIGAPLPNVVIAGDTIFCQGDSVSLSATGAINYLWSNGETTRKIYAKSTGIYSCVLTSINGCTTTSWSVNVTANPLPLVTLDPIANMCSTDPPFNLTGGTPSGGIFSGTGVSAGIFDPAVAGVGTFPVTYSYTDANNCTNTASQNIVVDFCQGINTVNASYSLNLKPVPATNFLEINFIPKSVTHLVLRMLNQLGQEVLFKDAGRINRFDEKLDVHQLSSGIYFLELTMDSEKAKIKIVIE